MSIVQKSNPESRFGHNSLTDALAFSAENFRNQVIVHVSPQDASEDEQTYRCLADDARALAELLLAKGWRRGDHLIFVVTDSRRFATAFWACLLAGIVPAPLSQLLNREPDSMEAEKIRNVISITGAPVLIDSRLDSYASLLTEIVENAGGKLLYADELLREAELGHFERNELPRISGDDVAVLQFSSGSSGLPKGVPLTHRNIIANIEGQIVGSDATKADVLCTWLPYFHDFGLFWGHLSALYLGMKQIRLDPGHFARRPLIWLEKLEKHRATVTNTTPTALNHLLGYMELKQQKGTVGPFDLSNLRSMLIGAEMIDPGDCRRAVRMLGEFGVPDTLMLCGYGLTETTVVATMNPASQPLRTRVVDRTELGVSGHIVDVAPDHPQAAEFVSIGPAAKYCELRIVDEEGTPLPPDRVGVIEIRGSNVMPGYYANDEANLTAFRHDGWFDTGDVGFMDADGYFTITGRAKEMIIVGGHNYYPWDIEQLAFSTPGAHDALRHATVCGFWNPALHREEIALFFVPKKVDEQMQRDALAAISQRVNTVAGFPIDSFIRLQMRDVPRTSSGKVMRRVLVDRLLDGTHQRLEQIDEAPAEAPDQEVRRRTPEEIRTLLQSLWSEALDVPAEEIKPSASLFGLGCNSLKASHIQGRLEEALGQRLETNFNYINPVLEDQVTHLVARDPSLEAPADEVELILRTVAHDVLDVPEHEIGVTQSLSALTGDLASAIELHGEIRRVFGLTEAQARELKGGSIRALAEEIRSLTGIGARETGSSLIPLMNFQETLYFHRKGFVRNEPSRLSCFIFIDLDLTAREGEIAPGLLGKAFDRVIRRHPMLRGVVDESRDRPHLRIVESVPPFEVEFTDLSDRSPEEAEAFLTRRGRDLNDVRFEIAEWPLFLCELYRKPGGHYALLFNIDHLLIDGYSFMHLLQEVFMAYDAILASEEEGTRSSGLDFGDYVLIEQARQRTASYRRAMERQLSLFENLPPKALLPFKTDPAAIEDVWFDTHYRMMDAELVSRLTKRAADNGVTLNSLLLAVWFKLVNLWSGQDDLVINMPVFNREQYFGGARSVIGTFIDIFPVRVRTGASESVTEIAKKVERFTRELLSVPVSSIELSRLIAQRDNATSGSMSSLIFSNSIGVYGGEFEELRQLDINNPMFRTGAPGTFIDLVLYDYRGEYYINWNYIRDLVDADYIELLAEQFDTICKDIAADVEDGETETATFDVAELLPESFKTVLAANNATETPRPETTIQALVAAQAERTPDAVALTAGEEEITYRALMERANQVANLLIGLGVGKQRDRIDDSAVVTADEGRAPFVAILFERSIDMIVAQLGVFQAGAAYVPVDPEYPPERLAYVIEDCQASVLLTQAHLLGRVPPSLPRIERVILTDSADPEASAPFATLDRSAIESMATAAPVVKTGPDDLAYMIYTSGSTGHPKGVMIPHRGIVNFLLWVREFYNLGPADNVALVTSYAFDMTLATNWTPLFCGARLHILHERETRDVEQLLRFLSERKISFLNVTPSHFSLLANARTHLDLDELPMVPDMRIMLGGEVINTKDLNAWLRHYPGHRFVNEYGPTEVSVATSAFPIPVSESGEVSMPVVPIGKPLANCTSYVLSPCGQPCMPNVAGELCLGGVGVAEGYFNKPDRTRAAFVGDPFRGGRARMYRTGDLARIWPDGNIEFLGRQDYQINLRGYRIEAGEVEAALTEHPDISQAVVMAQPDPSGQRQLVAYVVSLRDISTTEIREFLSERLPAYMVPALTKRMDTLPTTPSGKLDRKALPEIRDLSPNANRTARKSLGPTEQKIAALWSEVLGFDAIGPDDNFWDLGGDSLRAMRLIVRYREEGISEFGLRDMFRYPTIAETAVFLDDVGSETAPALLSVISPVASPRARLLFLPYACGNASSFIEVSRLLPKDVEVLAASHSEAWEECGGDLRKLAATLVESLPEPDGAKLIVAGYSFGGALACEVAAQLERRGRAADGIVVIAAAPPGITGESEQILDATDEAILQYSRKTYDFDPASLSEEEATRYLGRLRAETKGLLAYDFDHGGKLNTPAVILLGKDEEDKELQQEIGRWRQVFVTCSDDLLPGRHMLIKTHPQALASRLMDFVDSIAEGASLAKADLA